MTIGPDDDQVRIRASLENDVTGPAEAAAESIDELGDEAKGASPGVMLLDRRLRELRDTMIKTAATAKVTGRAIDDVGDEAAGAAAKTTAASAATKGLGSSFLSTAASGLKFAGFLSILPTALAIGVSGINALGAATIGLIGSFAKLTLNAQVIPSGMVAIAQTAAGAMLATQGLGGAIEALTTGEGIRKAMKELPAAMRPVAIAFADLKKNYIDPMKEGLAAALAPGLLDIADAAKKLMPVIEEGLMASNSALSSTLHSFAEVLKQTGIQNQIGRIMDTNAQSMFHVGQGLVSLFKVALDVLDAFRPVLLDMSEGFESWAKWLERVVDNANKTGKLTDMFESAYDTFKKWKDVTVDLVVGLYNIVRIGTGVTKPLGDSLADSIHDFRLWTESTKGENSIRNYFQDAVPIVKELGSWIKPLAGWFGDFLDEQSPHTLEFLQTFREDVAPALGRIVKVLLPLMTDGWIEIMQVSTPFLELIADLLELFQKLPDAIEKTVAAAAILGGLTLKFGGKGSIVKILTALGLMKAGSKAAPAARAAVTAGEAAAGASGAKGLFSGLRSGGLRGLLKGRGWIPALAAGLLAEPAAGAVEDMFGGREQGGTRGAFARGAGGATRGAAYGYSFAGIPGALVGAPVGAVLAQNQVTRAERWERLTPGLQTPDTGVIDTWVNELKIGRATLGDLAAEAQRDPMNMTPEMVALITQKYKTGQTFNPFPTLGRRAWAYTKNPAMLEAIMSTNQPGAEAVRQMFISQNRRLINRMAIALHEGDISEAQFMQVADVYVQHGIWTTPIVDKILNKYDAMATIAQNRPVARLYRGVKGTRKPGEGVGVTTHGRGLVVDGWQKTILDMPQNLPPTKKRINVDINVTTNVSSRNDAVKLGLTMGGQAVPGSSNIMESLRGLWAGGYVQQGEPALVGEGGPELFRSASGLIKEIGRHGPELMKFDASGIVFPNPVYEAAKESKLLPPTSGTSSSAGSFTFSPSVTINGSADDTDMASLRRELWMSYEAMKRDHDQRAIGRKT